jgi:hypothetical protein
MLGLICNFPSPGENHFCTNSLNEEQNQEKEALITLPGISPEEDVKSCPSLPIPPLNQSYDVIGRRE